MSFMGSENCWFAQHALQSISTFDSQLFKKNQVSIMVSIGVVS